MTESVSQLYTAGWKAADEFDEKRLNRITSVLTKYCNEIIGSSSDCMHPYEISWSSEGSYDEQFVDDLVPFPSLDTEGPVGEIEDDEFWDTV